MPLNTEYTKRNQSYFRDEVEAVAPDPLSSFFMESASSTSKSTEAAALEQLREKDPQAVEAPQAVAGLGIGELAALYAAGVLDFAV